MSHLNTYSGTLIKDATLKTVQINNDKEKISRKVVNFCFSSNSVTTPKKSKYFNVSLWFDSQDEVKQFEYLNKGMIISITGEEYCKPNISGEKVFLNYHIKAFRNSLSFLSQLPKSIQNLEINDEEIEMQDDDTNYLDEI